MKIPARLVAGLLGVFGSVPVALAANSGPPASPHAEFRIGGSINDGVNQMASLLELIPAQKVQVEALMEQRAKALRSTMTTALQAYRQGLDDLAITADQRWILRQSSSTGAALDKLAADLRLTTGERIAVKALMDQRAKSIRVAAEADQAAYQTGLTAVLTASQSATLAELESHSEGLSIPIGK